MYRLKDNFYTRVLLYFLFLSAARITAQTNPDDSTFSEGANLYSQGKYEPALEKFQWLTREGASFRVEESKIFIAKIHLQSKQYSVAEIELKDLLKKNTSSPYRDEMRFTLSDALWRQKKGYEALTVLMNGALLIKTDSLKQVNSTYITALLEKLSHKELQDANDAYKGKSEEVILTYCFAKSSAAKGDREKAKQLLYPVVANVSLNTYRDLCVK